MSPNSIGCNGNFRKHPFLDFLVVKNVCQLVSRIVLLLYKSRKHNANSEKLNYKMILFMQIEAINYYFSHLRDLLYLKQKRGVKKISKHTSLTIFLVLCCDLGNV